MDDGRPDPDALLAHASAEGKGRLKIYLGAAPGVGKTWEMLSAARRRVAAGGEVLIGVVETHGRAGTDGQLGDLPILSRLPVPYRGQTLEEFDLAAALARRPALLLMDELAHTNAPGSRHAKRWEDVRDLLDAGVDVWATLNIQHLESLNDTVARITGIRVTETLPDKVLEMADEIELVDLPPAELQARLRDGHIYRPDVARRALDGFFREGNLQALREIALRRAAEHVDGDMRDYMRRNAIGGPWPATERVLALIGSEAAAAAVVRQAKRQADALHAPWVALHVERAGNPMALVSPLELAAQLGATVDVQAGPDLIAIVLDAARRHNASQIVMGRARPVLWRRLSGRTLAAQLLASAPGLALHVVPLIGPHQPPPRRVARPDWLAWVAAPLGVAAITAAAQALGSRVPGPAMGMVYLLVVVLAGSFAGLQVALMAAALGFLAWDFFFLPPLYQFTIGSVHDSIALAVFAIVALVTGSLASRVRAEARSGQARIDGLRRIAQFSRRLGEPAAEPELIAEIARQAAGIAGRAVVMMQTGEDLVIRGAEPAADTMDEASWAAARWCASHDEPTGRGTATLPSAAWRFLPLRTVRGRFGLLGVHAGQDRALDGPWLQTLSALADQAAVALERVAMANQAARSAASAETQKLRTALLNSLSHDLRTPLTGIRGAAETLEISGDRLDAAQRLDLLASIQQDTGRMTKFLTNIMDLTRLESGAISPRLAPTPLAELIDAAIARVPGLDTVAVRLPDDLPPVRADATLLEQALVNLLDNAHRYAPAGSLVRVSGHAAAGRVTLTVADEGVGIPAADLPHVFDSFYRASRGDRVAPGTGLGLAIARGMVEAMGGSIEAVSPRPDAARDGSPGTMLILVLPAA